MDHRVDAYPLSGTLDRIRWLPASSGPICTDPVLQALRPARSSGKQLREGGYWGWKGGLAFAGAVDDVERRLSTRAQASRGDHRRRGRSRGSRPGAMEASTLVTPFSTELSQRIALDRATVVISGRDHRVALGAAEYQGDHHRSATGTTPLGTRLRGRARVRRQSSTRLNRASCHPRLPRLGDTL